jgi:hypothetical protein
MGTYSDLLQSGAPAQPHKPAEVKAARVAVPKPTKSSPTVIDPPKPSSDETSIPRNHDAVIPRHHDTIDGLLETVRKAVKELGEKAATHRFTAAEKQAVADLIYTYKRQGIKTSENEIARIAINYLIEDFQRNGEQSVLDRVIKDLNS